MSVGSKILDLPRELRDMIYEYIVGSNRDDGQLAFLAQAQSPMFGREELFKRSWSEISSLFATNRQIQSEVLDMLYRKSYFLVQANWCPDGILSCKSWIQAARIRYMLLCISLPGNGGVYDFGECNHKNPMEPLCEPGWRYRCVNLGFLTNMASLRHVKLFVHYSVRNSICDTCDMLALSKAPSFGHMVAQIISEIPQHVDMEFGRKDSEADMEWISIPKRDRLLDADVMRMFIGPATLNCVAP